MQWKTPNVGELTYYIGGPNMRGNSWVTIKTKPNKKYKSRIYPDFTLIICPGDPNPATYDDGYGVDRITIAQALDLMEQMVSDPNRIPKLSKK
jgi:hypothetical protein